MGEIQSMGRESGSRASDPLRIANSGDRHRRNDRNDRMGGDSLGGEQMNEEIWKDIEGYDGRYQVSNRGRIKSLPHVQKNRYSKYTTKEKILAPRFDGDGYCCAALYTGGKREDRRVHRIVAETFIPNPEGKAFINHKDGVKTNNSVENLEWCTAAENAQHAFRTGLNRGYRGQENKISRKICQLTLDGKFLRFWHGVREIKRELNISYQNVEACLKGRRANAGGYKWTIYTK